MSGQLLVKTCWTLVLLAGFSSGCGGDRAGDPGGGNGPDVAPPVDIEPVWSPVDSSQIAYTHWAVTWDEYLEFGRQSVWVASVDTAAPKYIASGMIEDWLPDGSGMVISRDDTFWLLILDDGSQTLLLDCGMCGAARCSPSGALLSYYSDDRHKYGTWLLELHSKEEYWLSHYGAWDWSPDGEYLICDSLVIIDVTGDWVEKIPYSPEFGYVNASRWSPDGETIAFSGNLKVWTIGRSGSDERVVADPGLSPCWSPDGRWLAYSAPTPDRKGTAIWMINANGSGRRQVTFPEIPD